MLKNSTVFPALYTRYKPCPDREYFLVLLSASFYLSNVGWHICDEQVEPPLIDHYWSDEDSSIRLPTQMSIGKPGTDIIVNGMACAPGGNATERLLATVSLQKLTSSVAVFGDRYWDGNRISRPIPFSRKPIIWENAFGGSYRHPESSRTVSYSYNPIGKGWTPPGQTPLAGAPLPNIEWPNQLITRPDACPAPAGFGALPAQHPYRAKHAGTYDEQWRRDRSPFLPRDFDPLFFHAAMPNLRSHGYLKGGEFVRLTNLHLAGELEFTLPFVKPQGRVLGGTAQKDHFLGFNLETVVIESEQLVVRLFWKAALLVTNPLNDAREIQVFLSKAD